MASLAKPAWEGSNSVTGFSRAWLTASILLAALMQVVDTTIANVALPTIQGSLSASPEQSAWVLTSYLIAAALATPATGWLANRFGRNTFLSSVIVGFTLSSLLCGLSASLEMLVFARVIQGLFGAALVPLSQSLLLDAYPKSQHGRAMALWGMCIMVGPVIGPPLGGWLTENYSWRWVFFINIPLGLISFFGVWRRLGNKADRSVRFDMMGFVYLTMSVVAIQLLIDRGARLGWWESLEIQIEIILAILGIYLYAIHSRTCKTPFVNLGLFLDRNFATASVFMAIISGVLYATIAMIPSYMQRMMDYPMFTVGLVLAPRGIGTIIAMGLVGRALELGVTIRGILAAGIVTTAASLFIMSGFGPEEPTSPIVWAGFLQGIGIGLIGVPVTTSAYMTLKASLRTEAAGLYSLVRSLGAGLGISAVFTFIARTSQINHAHLSEGMYYTNPVILPEAWNIDTVNGVALLNQEISRQAEALTYINTFALLSFITLASLPLVLIFRKPSDDLD